MHDDVMKTLYSSFFFNPPPTHINWGEEMNENENTNGFVRKHQSKGRPNDSLKTAD